MDDNAIGNNSINRIHHYLNLQENVAAKIDRHTKNLQRASTTYDAVEKKLKEFGTSDINYLSFSKALFLIACSIFILYRLVTWLFFLSHIPPAIVILLYCVLSVGTLYVARRYIQQSFINYKKTLETQAMQCKNTIEQSKKNIDNRIHELHEVQQRLQQLWGQKHE